MRATHFSLLLWLSGSSFLVAQSTTPAYPFRDPSLDLEKRVNNVLSLMTVEEKIDSLSTSGVVAPRLGIKGTPIGEALSGVALGGPIYSMLSVIPGPTHGQPSPVTPTTQFPQGVGLGRTWDRALMHEAGAVIGSEARYIHENGLNAKSYLILLTPNADLARDPRWGRDQESYGEDAYFNGAMAAPFIKGIQGDDPKYWQAASLVKHFLATSASSVIAWPTIARAHASRIAGSVAYTSCTIVPTRQVNSGSSPLSSAFLISTYASRRSRAVVRS